MANTPVVVLDDTLTDIANAIRGKNGSSNTYRPGQMADAIDNIPAGTLGIPREVSQTGVYRPPEQNFTFSLPSNATDVSSSALNAAFQGCTGLTSVDLSSLTTVSGSKAFGYAFQGCTSLTSVSFPALTTSSFGTATNQFDNMLVGVTGCTVHFPAAIQSTIGNWSSVQNGFGGTNTTVLFDL